jgi:hypothetical protein
LLFQSKSSKKNFDFEFLHYILRIANYK